MYMGDLNRYSKDKSQDNSLSADVRIDLKSEEYSVLVLKFDETKCMGRLTRML